MEEDWKLKYLKHLERVSRGIEQMKKELIEDPDDFGNFEHCLYFAIRGVNPRKAICAKHHRKLHKNDYGEFICGDCIEDLIEKDIYDENLFFDPDDEPAIKIQGMSYGSS